MRSQKAFRSILSSMIVTLMTMLSRLIIPRLIIYNFGSDVNGLVTSIDQFLGYITVMEAGLSGVVHAALYKPLANGDKEAVSAIVKSAKRFFRGISIAFVLYLIGMMVVYPMFVNDSFDRVYTMAMVFVIGISVVFYYSIGMAYQLLLEADQRKYVVDISQITLVVVDLVVVLILVYSGAGIHLIKLASSLLFAIRPLVLWSYVRKKYKLDAHVTPDERALDQRWDGLGHHIAHMVHINTDVALITLFLNVREVSVYMIHYLVVAGVRSIVSLVSQGVDAAFGNMIANKEQDSLESNFKMVELLLFALTTVFFTAAGILIVPFITVYSQDVTDANYIRPLFATFLVLSEVMYCIRIPYELIVKSAGHFKQTRPIALQEAGFNLVLSTMLIQRFGLTGAAFGTLLAMTYRTIRYAHYLSQNILFHPIGEFFKKAGIYSVAAALIVALSHLLPGYQTAGTSLVDWVIQAVFVTTIAAIVVLIVSLVFYRGEVNQLVELAKRVLPMRPSRPVMEEQRKKHH